MVVREITEGRDVAVDQLAECATLEVNVILLDLVGKAPLVGDTVSLAGTLLDTCIVIVSELECE